AAVLGVFVGLTAVLKCLDMGFRCLFSIVILFVAGWLVWELSPLQEWIGTGKGYWEQLSSWFGTVTGWIGDLGGDSGGGTGTGTGTG
ncbi:hypothetical protein ACWDRX_38760, partial [Streptomyces nigra]